MNAKRANNAVWKLLVPQNVTPEDQLAEVVAAYEELMKEDSKYKRLDPVPLQQPIPNVHLDLYVRSSFSPGLRPFLSGYLESEDDGELLNLRGADACLFMTVGGSLYAITSGSGYHIIANFVDYSFPFDTAKKLISNNFSAADVREMSGSRSSRSETYRLAYSIDKSDAVGTVWKKLVGRINLNKLPATNPLKKFIKNNRSPALEIKSSFVWRAKMSLTDVVDMIEGIESLPEPSAESLRELSFLDNLYPIKNDQELTDRLTSTFVEDIRVALTGGELPDIDILDPDDIIPYNAGSNFKLERTWISDGPPSDEELVKALLHKAQGVLNDAGLFRQKFIKWGMSYSLDPDDGAKARRRKLLEFLHGQVDYADKTYFRIDKVWYRTQGEFLDNLKRDFIEEVFESDRAILLGSDISFLPWDDGDEGQFNMAQAAEADFYFGDEIFAKYDGGQVELFDLLKVDDQQRKLYIIQTKDSFGAKIRDACSQIRVAATVIANDLITEKRLLKTYYQDQWSRHERNAGVDEETFLSWFGYELVYVVLCSTKQEFTAEDFEVGRLRSHIARREILATKNEMRRALNNPLAFRLAHTRHKSGA